MIINRAIAFKDLTIQPEITSNDYVAGLREVESGVFIDYRYSLAGIGGNLKLKIESGVNGKSITDAFFVNTISEIVTLNQVYLADEDFVQTGSTIVFINLDLYIGQKLLCKV